jgi:dTDP-4-dehydrorhamnose reductase
MHVTGRQRAAIELWGGVECTVNRLGDQWSDQCSRSGHDGRIDDLERFAGLGLTALRYPALWERIVPTSLDSPQWQWLDARLSRLRALGIRPILGLVHHGSGPAYTALLDAGFPERLECFARMVAERYPWVCDYTPVNEPLTTARFSALYGHWYPHHRNDRSFVRALVHQCRGIVLAMRAIRAVNPAARLIQTEDCGTVSGTPGVREQVEHEQHRRWLTWDLLTGQVCAQHPLHGYLRASGMQDREFTFFEETPCAPDILGLNYYLTSDRFLDERLERYPAGWHGSNGNVRYADVEAVRVAEANPVGHETHLQAAWERYRLPVALTEVHLSCTREEQARWFVEAWTAAQRAREGGADVRAITAWALLGAYDWNSLVTRLDGHYEPGVFDVRSSPPRATFLASVVRDLGRGRWPSHPIFDSPGWWRRSDRFFHSGVASCARRARGRPLLIVGADGRLGRIWQQICAARGLAAHALQAGVDATVVEAALQHVRPWGVVHVAACEPDDADDGGAEREWRRHVSDATVLAAACQRQGIRLVTFSSAFVFDGNGPGACAEEDPPQPVSGFARSRYEAERRTTQASPSALIIRAGARFSSDEDGNIVARVRDRLVGAAPVAARADAFISPAYEPDVVNAALDLFIDEEQGIWHLVNSGTPTSYEFACEVARVYNFPPDVVGPVRAPAVGDVTAPPCVLISARGTVMRSFADALAACAREAGCDAALADVAVAQGDPQCVSS